MPGRDELAELAASFNSMADELTGQMRALFEEGARKQRLVDALAHELRTPLTAIGGYAQYLAVAAATPDERLSALGYIERESVRLSELAEKLLLLTRLRTDAPERRAISLSGPLSDAAAACRGMAESRDVTLTLEAGGAVWATDGQLLQLIALNLIQNAVRACHPGGSVLVTATERALTVQDDGRGMDKETLSHITEPFYRADKARARAEGGAGLGLALVQSAADLLGLTLVFSSAPGAGTVATVLQADNNAETAP